MTNRRPGPRSIGRLALFLLLVCLSARLFAQAPVLPLKPDRYVTDDAGVLDGGTADAINHVLEQVEKETSNQLLVAIYPNLPTGADLAQYCTDLYHAWGVGQKGKDNGAILFVFVNDHRIFISTGRGLEGALPDATCKNIIDKVIAPQFRQGFYPAGIQAGVNAMIAATKGEYQGAGTTVDERKSAGHGIPWVVILIFIIIFILTRYGSSSGWSGPVIFTGGGWGGGGYGGGFGGGGGGGFSGGGGDSAGGGAGGSW